MTKLNMVLTPKDEEKIQLLKEKYGLTQTAELGRFLITNMVDKIKEEKKSN